MINAVSGSHGRSCQKTRRAPCQKKGSHGKKKETSNVEWTSFTPNSTICRGLLATWFSASNGRHLPDRNWCRTMHLTRVAWRKRSGTHQRGSVKSTVPDMSCRPACLRASRRSNHHLSGGETTNKSGHVSQKKPTSKTDSQTQADSTRPTRS